MLSVICVLILSSRISAQIQSSEIWSEISEYSFQPVGSRLIIPDIYKTFDLNLSELKEVLIQAPSDFSSDLKQKKIILELPLPDGTFGRFWITESSVMAEQLSQKYPDIKTYSGRGIDDPFSSVKLDLTPLGFHAMILSPKGNIFIDPHNQFDVNHYISYYARDFSKKGVIRDCTVLFDDEKLTELKSLLNIPRDTPVGPELRVYRLACAATGEYTQFHGGTVSSGLAAVVTSINRVNGVYETEVAVRMILVANNDTLIFTNPTTDPYNNNDGGVMLGQNQTTVDNRIGPANYDIGHVFSTGGGGIAYLGVVCVNGWKAQGVTGLPNPIGDPFDIDYVAHEIGHQYGANHTFNSITGSCGGGNRNASTAYEPGSGSTIMAYAGICGADNLQLHSDPYFHVISFDEIVSYTTLGNGNSCPSIINTGNNAPIVNVGSGGFTIPIGTPFSLTGSASDPDGDTLTFCWEEFDLGPAGSPNNPSGNAPIFRSFLPVESSTRIFPKLTSIINNTNIKGEILPTYSRSLNFRLTARDNRIGGGGVNYSQISFSVTQNAGPFKVTSPNTNISWPGNSVQTIVWDVANTNISPVNVSSVNILLSTDGGFTYPILLTANTPNDGVEDVVIPNIPNTTSRIKVEAVGNIFFDISNTNFTIDQEIPVELISANIIASTNGVLIEWRTASETNNKGFSIERSTDGNEFSEIAFIEGKGTSTQINSYSYFDNSVKNGLFYYRLKQIDFNGTYKYLKVLSVDLGMPKNYTLEQNHPNPFNPVTKIRFQLPVIADVKIILYNSLGQQIDVITDREFTGGIHEVDFNGYDFSSGVYYYTMNASGKDGKVFSSTKKMILMK
ncbi:MAG: hypothetical protein HXY49_10600 [Ignavibacteriaceae bacterium]|nr:hypothetical protein [Ignavibacteriaceae bacterium]